MPVPKGTKYFVVTRGKGKNKSKVRIAQYRGKTVEAKKLKSKKKRG